MVGPYSAGRLPDAEVAGAGCCVDTYVDAIDAPEASVEGVDDVPVCCPAALNAWRSCSINAATWALAAAASACDDDLRFRTLGREAADAPTGATKAMMRCPPIPAARWKMSAATRLACALPDAAPRPPPRSASSSPRSAS